MVESKLHLHRIYATNLTDINTTTYPTVVMVTAAHHTASNTPLGKNSGNSSVFER